MAEGKPFHVYIVLGEESGDHLAADLIPSLEAECEQRGRRLRISGLAGTRMQAMGHRSLFDIEEIAVMGFSAVIGRLPKIVRRVWQTVADILARKPDLILLIDSPDFTHAVAKRVRKKWADAKVVNYICPSVWAWRSGRAKAMTAYVDHVLCILPFEPAALERLQGPCGTYIGHPLARRLSHLPEPSAQIETDIPTLLLLPGSRRSELKLLLAIYGETLTVLRNRGVQFRTVLPAVARLRSILEQETANWSVPVDIVYAAENEMHFQAADAAMATSGTVALELALHGVPMVTGYKVDAVARPFVGMVTTWSALLPNLILDRLLITEEINELVLPERMARHVEALLTDESIRQRQIAGFQDLRKAMETQEPPAVIASRVIADVAGLSMPHPS
ncbi:MAG: lipid-A-disaccharide synthase [Pseudomonadota bacterium]